MVDSILANQFCRSTSRAASSKSRSSAGNARRAAKRSRRWPGRAISSPVASDFAARRPESAVFCLELSECSDPVGVNFKFDDFDSPTRQFRYSNSTFKFSGAIPGRPPRRLFWGTIATSATADCQLAPRGAHPGGGQTPVPIRWVLNRALICSAFIRLAEP